MAKKRCPWCNMNNPLYIRYHDEEWGRPVHDDATLFELLLLEPFQAGLSWECVLKKREAFRKAFADFDPAAISTFDSARIDAMMQDAGIIRNRKKIEAAVNNAGIYLSISAEWGSFDAYVWHFTGGQTVREFGLTRSPLSDTMASDLKKRGMRFIGSTTVYAYLQAVGVIDGHAPGCYLFQAPHERGANE